MDNLKIFLISLFGVLALALVWLLVVNTFINTGGGAGSSLDLKHIAGFS